MDQQDNYKTLVHLLSKSLKSIEIVPSEAIDSSSSNQYAPFLYMDGHLGISQSILVKCYLQAIRLFDSLRNKENSTELFSSTSVIMIANPAHITALNRRKVFLRGHAYHTKTDAAEAVTAELCFLEAVLSIKECAKQNDLWHHRRWILELASSSDEKITSLDRLVSEISLSERACESFPRNYHAWAHRSWCLRSFFQRFRTMSDTTLEKTVRYILDELQRARKWVELHISDTSGVSYLCTMLQWMYSYGFNTHRLHVDSDNADLVHALSLVREYPSHETLWIYLRHASTKNCLNRKLDDKAEILSVVQPLLSQSMSKIYAIRYMYYVALSYQNINGGGEPLYALPGHLDNDHSDDIVASFWGIKHKINSRVLT